MLLEIARGAADGVGGVVPDVDVAVTIEVHGIGAEAARHELRQAHGPGVGPLESQRVDLLLAGQQQEFLELLAEEGLTRRVVEARGRQRIDHAMAAGVATIEGFHADDRHDNFGRHAVLGFGTGQRRLVLAPEVDTGRRASR